jgi:predicted amidohydrolase
VSDTEDIGSYRALALQVECRTVNGAASADDARQRIAANIERIGAQIAASHAFIGDDLRLIVLPEYVLTGFPVREPVEAWIERACLRPGGQEYAALGQVAAGNRVWLAGNAYETDEHFPGLYFQTCFVIGPDGGTALRYRRLNSMYAATPHDVWDRYIELYGLEGVFPVARTRIGNLAPIASEEVLYPEIARCFVMRGAEVFVHSTSEVGSPRQTVKAIARQARAIENLAYIVSANTAGIIGTPIPAASVDGGSCIVDFAGRVTAEAGPGESMVAVAEIDLVALRRERRRPGMANLLSRQRFEAVSPMYGRTSFYPPNTLTSCQSVGRSHFVDTQLQTIERLVREGVIR